MLSETIRTIFTLYLELGSMGALLAELDRRAIRTKINSRRDGQKGGGIRFGVGSLAHLLENRFYIGEGGQPVDVGLGSSLRRCRILLGSRTLKGSS